jgi:hypothetical protein
MQFQTTAGIYEANDRIPVQTIAKIYRSERIAYGQNEETLAGVTDTQVAVLPDGEKMVDRPDSRTCLDGGQRDVPHLCEAVVEGGSKRSAFPTVRSI